MSIGTCSASGAFQPIQFYPLSLGIAILDCCKPLFPIDDGQLLVSAVEFHLRPKLPNQVVHPTTVGTSNAPRLYNPACTAPTLRQ